MKIKAADDDVSAEDVEMVYKLAGQLVTCKDYLTKDIHLGIAALLVAFIYSCKEQNMTAADMMEVFCETLPVDSDFTDPDSAPPTPEEPPVGPN